MPVALFGGFATFVRCGYVSSWGWGWSEVKSCNMVCVCGGGDILKQVGVASYN